MKTRRIELNYTITSNMILQGIAYQHSGVPIILKIFTPSSGTIEDIHIEDGIRKEGKEYIAKVYYKGNVPRITTQDVKRLLEGEIEIEELTEELVEMDYFCETLASMGTTFEVIPDGEYSLYIRAKLPQYLCKIIYNAIQEDRKPNYKEVHPGNEMSPNWVHSFKVVEEQDSNDGKKRDVCEVAFRTRKGLGKAQLIRLIDGIDKTTWTLIYEQGSENTQGYMWKKIMPIVEAFTRLHDDLDQGPETFEYIITDSPGKPWVKLSIEDDAFKNILNGLIKKSKAISNN